MLMQHNLSGTTDHDLDSQGYITLAKRLSAQSTNDDEMS